MKRSLQLLLMVLAGAVLGAQGGGEQRITPSEVKWPAPAAGGVGTSGVAGTQTVVLKGDPTKPGLYTMLLRVGPNTKIDAHAHPDDRVATVISGDVVLRLRHAVQRVGAEDAAARQRLYRAAEHESLRDDARRGCDDSDHRDRAIGNDLRGSGERSGAEEVDVVSGFSRTCHPRI